MMMSKPDSEASKKEQKRDAVADLERRLAMLRNFVPEQPAAAAPVIKETPRADPTPPANAMPPPAASAKTTSAGGTNPLLARILAAQERTRRANAAPPAAPPVDSLSDSTTSAPPPPAFDETMLPPPVDNDESPPPAFDDSFLPPPPAAAAAPPIMWNPPPLPPPAPSAPAFDLLAHHDDTMGALPAPVQPPRVVVDNDDTSAVEAILGMQGLSNAEKKALLAEQANILASIERGKKTTTSGAEQRVVQIGDHQQAVLHGAEITQSAIADGTALQVQCLSCENWMHVVATASMMFCPVCQTVSPVDLQNMRTADEAAQMQADQELAEALQKEEYQTSAEREPARPEREKKKTAAVPAVASTGSSSSSTGGWRDWLGLSSGTTQPATVTKSRATSGSDQETIHLSSSYDAGQPPRGSSRRVTESKPLFACVTDSISEATTSFQATPTDAEDDEESTPSLLAVTNVGRNSNKGERS